MVVIDEAAIEQRYKLLREQGLLDERGRRLWAAVEARSHGRGGIAAVIRATGISESTVTRGLAELDRGEVLAAGRVRRRGAGNKPVTETHPGIEKALEELVDGGTRGDPQSPLRWTSRSASKLADGLREVGHDVAARTVLRLLRGMGYSLQANRKTLEGAAHPDRDAQFEHIAQAVTAALAAGQPVICVDAKQRELVGDFKAVGRELAPGRAPVKVRTHDFKDKQPGHAIPFGVYDVGADEGFVNVGIDNNTAQFAVAAIHDWWTHLGLPRYPDATRLMITADSGSSNSYRSRLWKTELQNLANATGLHIQVCHYPPGTSKWNKIEHRLFSFISINWRGKPLVSHEVIINLIAATTTKTGLTVYARLDDREYPKGIQISDTDLNAVNLHPADFHGDWNYTITPPQTES